MTGRLLYLGNSPNRNTVARLDRRFGDWGLKVEFHWAYGGDFPDRPGDYDGVFISGSLHGAYEDIEFIHREHGFLCEAEETGLPMLGVCFGSQILASALCGRDQVFRRDHCEIGYKDLKLTEAAGDDILCTELLDVVRMFVWHNDEVRHSHEDMTILASSDECPNHIWRFRDRPIWGIQGHPEITEEQAPVWFEENRDRMHTDGADVDQLKLQAHPALEAKTMLQNFAELVSSGA